MTNRAENLPVGVKQRDAAIALIAFALRVPHHTGVGARTFYAK